VIEAMIFVLSKMLSASLVKDFLHYSPQMAHDSRYNYCELYEQAT